MRVTKLWVALTGTAAAVVLAGCSAGPHLAAVEPVVAAGTPAPATTTPAPATTTTPPVTTTTTQPPSTTTSTTTKTTPKKTTTTPKKTTVKPAANPTVPCHSTDGACVDISAKKAWLLRGGKVVYGPVPITTGRKGYPTPTGTFHVLSKEKMHYSKEFDNGKMPNSVFFYPGDAFHTGSLSAPSHGCVHLSSTASLKFFNTLSVGDPVQVVP